MRHPRLAHGGLLFFFLAAGCSDRGHPTEPAYPGDALHAISDGSHNGMKGFYFLAPLVKQPAYSGTFDPSVSPLVEVCASAGCGSIHATFSMTDGTGSEVVRLDREGESYIVHWHTDRTGAVAGETYRVRVRVGDVVLGHADVSIASSGREARSVESNEAIALVAGRVLPIKFRIETGTEDDTPVVSRIEIEPAEATIDVGATQQFTATVYDQNDEVIEGQPLTWSNSNTAVATVESGLATGISAGQATIRAAIGTVSGSGQLTVEEPFAGPQILPQTVSAGSSHSCGLDTAGRAYCWGSNANGRLGDGTTIDRPVPTAVQTSRTFAAISAGSYHTVGVTLTGRVYAWGGGQSGALGNGDVSDRTTPVAVSLPAGVVVTSVSAANGFTAAVTSGGRVYTWGWNFNGQLGDGTTTNRSLPEAVETAETFSSVNGGAGHTVALTTDGRAYAWGNNNSGRLGTGTTTNSLTPVPVVMPSGVTFSAIVAGVMHTLALTTDGRVYAWGSNENGRLGDGTFVVNRLTPVPVALPAGVTVREIDAGFRYSLALTSSGVPYTWGGNDFGQLGDGSGITQRTIPGPVQMPVGVTTTAIAAGISNGIAISSTGAAYAWGLNDVGQLGDGTTTNRNPPVQVLGGVTFRHP